MLISLSCLSHHFFLFSFSRFNALLTIESFTNISNSFQTNQHISFKYACYRCFKYFSNSISWNWLSLRDLCFIVKTNAIILSKCVQLNLILCIWRRLISAIITMIWLKSLRTKRSVIVSFRVSLSDKDMLDLIWFDLIWFDLIWFVWSDLIWFSRSTAFYNIYRLSCCVVFVWTDWHTRKNFRLYAKIQKAASDYLTDELDENQTWRSWTWWKSEDDERRTWSKSIIRSSFEYQFRKHLLTCKKIFHLYDKFQKAASDNLTDELDENQTWRSWTWWKSDDLNQIIEKASTVENFEREITHIRAKFII